MVTACMALGFILGSEPLTKLLRGFEHDAWKAPKNSNNAESIAFLEAFIRLISIEPTLYYLKKFLLTLFQEQKH